MPTAEKKFQFDMRYLARLSRDIGPGHPDPDRDIWAETIHATGINPDDA